MRKRESEIDRSIREAEESRHFIDTVPDHNRNPKLSANLDLAEGQSKALDDMGNLVSSLPTMQDVTPETIEQEKRIREQLRHESRYRRMYLMERKYHLALQALDELEHRLRTGEDGKGLAVSAAQARLLVKDYFNLTREEYGDKEQVPLVDARRQTINVIKIVEVDPSNNGHIIDVEDFDVIP